MRHDATRQNATRKPCALTLRSRRAIRDSNEAPPALLAPEPVEPGRLKTLGRSWKKRISKWRKPRIEMKRIEKRLEMTWDLEKFEVRSRIFQGKSFRVENIAQVIFASDSSWDFDTSDRPKKSFFLCVRYLGSSPSTCCFKHTAGFLPCPVTRRSFKHERL